VGKEGWWWKVNELVVDLFLTGAATTGVAASLILRY
jgi:hypothetical protein